MKHNFANFLKLTRTSHITSKNLMPDRTKLQGILFCKNSKCETVNSDTCLKSGQLLIFQVNCASFKVKIKHSTVPCKETRLFAIFLYKLAILGNLEMTLNLYKTQSFLQISFKIL